MLFQLSYAEYGIGVGRYRSFYLLLAKQILYHLSYDPVALLVEIMGIDPITSRMQSERSTI